MPAALARLRDDLTRTITERVNDLAGQEEGSPEAMARLLGDVQAVRQVTRALAATEARLRRQPTAALEKRREELMENLSALAIVLRRPR